MITRDPDITRLLNRLEDRGFVERTRAGTIAASSTERSPLPG
jgi:DNA-binding PadR family transcriptional regulator